MLEIVVSTQDSVSTHLVLHVFRRPGVLNRTFPHLEWSFALQYDLPLQY